MCNTSTQDIEEATQLEEVKVRFIAERKILLVERRE